MRLSSRIIFVYNLKDKIGYKERCYKKHIVLNYLLIIFDIV